ncbi:MAG: arginine repressor, partial [bacterium]
MNDNTKNRRQFLLKKLISKFGLSDQKCIQNELEKQGIKTTQATISRDLQELGVVKVPTGTGLYKYEIIEKPSSDIVWDRLKILFNNFVVEIQSTNNLILIKTTPGKANGVASLIDKLHHEDILGTIAGDD